MNAAEQIRGWWRSLTGKSQAGAPVSGGTYQRPESLCPECGSAALDEHYDGETSTQVSSCPDCGYLNRHEVLFGNDSPARRRRPPED